MGLFIAIALLSIAVSVLVARPLLLGGNSADDDVTGAEIYHDQLRQLDADKKDGLISGKDATSARAEIARRLLALEDANSQPGGATTVGKPAIVLGLVVALGLPLMAGAIYLEIGKPGLAGQPLASRTDRGVSPDAETAIAATEQHDSELADLVTQLEQRLEAQPDDIDGWALLARSYITQGKIQDAAKAYGKAVELTGGTEPLLRGEQSELLTILNGGIVSPEAEAGFSAVIATDPDEPRARFYLGLAKAQKGQIEDAMTDWSALINSADPGEAWVGPVTERVIAIAGESGLDPADFGINAAPAPQAAPQTADTRDPDAPRGPTSEQMAAASDMSETDQQAMINSMVAGLRERLDNGDGGPDGWMRLARAYGVLGNQDEQLHAYRKAAGLAPDDTDIQLALANALMDVGEGRVSAEASAVLNRVLKADPDNAEALWNLGRAAADLGNESQARDHWTRLLGIVSDNVEAKSMVQEALDSLNS